MTMAIRRTLLLLALVPIKTRAAFTCAEWDSRNDACGTYVLSNCDHAYVTTLNAIFREGNGNWKDMGCLGHVVSPMYANFKNCRDSAVHLMDRGGGLAEINGECCLVHLNTYSFGFSSKATCETAVAGYEQLVAEFRACGKGQYVRKVATGTARAQCKCDSLNLYPHLIPPFPNNILSSSSSSPISTLASSLT